MSRRAMCSIASRTARDPAISIAFARGLNENYARELMELHTLGVDGGYTRHDVVEVARAFTGWSIAAPRDGGGFVFRPALHDAGEKHVLGEVIRAGGGEQDGERVLDILARRPATARMVATTLARRLVSDDPPAGVVDRARRRASCARSIPRRMYRRTARSIRAAISGGGSCRSRSW